MMLILQSVLRRICVGLIYFSVLLALGVGFLKAALAAFTALVLLFVGLGRLVLGQLAVCSLVFLMIDWMGLLPLRAWGRGLIALIDRALL